MIRTYQTNVLGQEQVEVKRYPPSDGTRRKATRVKTQVKLDLTKFETLSIEDKAIVLAALVK